MEIVLLLVAGAAIAGFFYRAQRRSVPAGNRAEPTMPVGMPTIEVDVAPLGGPVAAPGGGWVINPGAPFALTLQGVDAATALQIRDAISAGFGYWERRKLAALIAKTNVRCREIDVYVNEFRPQYLGRLEELKLSHPEWADASEGDRADLLVSLRRQAIESLDVRPCSDIEPLFECEPADAAVDDALIARYGIDAIQLYLRSADNLEKVRVVPASNERREGFEELVRLGLARRGAEIEAKAIAETLTMKEIQALVQDLDAPVFRRKAKAVEYLVSLPDAKARLERAVTMRELFQLRQLPAEFDGLDLDAVSSAWRWAEEVAFLLAHTFSMSEMTRAQDVLHRESMDIVRGWKSLDAGEQSCPMCRRMATRQFPKDQPPRLPFHLGCRCCMSPEV